MITKFKVIENSEGYNKDYNMVVDAFRKYAVINAVEKSLIPCHR